MSDMADTADMTGDDAGGRWTVRGVPRDVQRLALDAARAAGVPLGAWLSDLIRERAGGPVPVTDCDALADLVARVERLERATFGDGGRHG